jgi:hypothetical protein
VLTSLSPRGGAPLDRATYAEAELVENRAAVLLYGGTAAERQAWAEETAGRLGGPATLVGAPEALAQALAQKEGVVFVVDAVALGDTGQQLLVQCLQTQEERPKLVVALAHGVEGVLGAGGLRPDLHYRLRLAQVNLDAPGLREAMAKRRARAAVTRAVAPRPSERPPSRAAAARSKSQRRMPAKTQRKRPKPRRAPAKRSRR